MIAKVNELSQASPSQTIPGCSLNVRLPGLGLRSLKEPCNIWHIVFISVGVLCTTKFYHVVLHFSFLSHQYKVLT